MQQTAVPFNVLVFCAEECARQQSGEMSVVGMCEAWFDMLCQESICSSPCTTNLFLSLDDILEWGRLIEPIKNQNGFRRTPVYFVDMSTAIDADLVPKAMKSLLIAIQDGALSAEEVYQEFEKIHPFIEGNGRLGSLLFNMVRGSLLVPICPPEFHK